MNRYLLLGDCRTASVSRARAPSMVADASCKPSTSPIAPAIRTCRIASPVSERESMMSLWLTLYSLGGFISSMRNRNPSILAANLETAFCHSLSPMGSVANASGHSLPKIWSISDAKSRISAKYASADVSGVFGSNVEPIVGSICCPPPQPLNINKASSPITNTTQRILDPLSQIGHAIITRPFEFVENS